MSPRSARSPPQRAAAPRDMVHSETAPAPSRATVTGVGLLSAALLMTELAWTRLFSVTMYYHFAFLAISIALFGLSASGVCVFLFRQRLARVPTDTLLARGALMFAASLLVALACLVRLRVGLTFSLDTALRMTAIYVLAGLPFFAGGGVIALALSRYARRVNAVYAADLIGAAAGCLLLIPIVNLVGAPGGVLFAAGAGAVAAALFAPSDRRTTLAWSSAILLVAIGGRTLVPALFDLTVTKGHEDHRVLFSKWNSFSRIGVYDVPYGDWSLSPTFSGALPATLLMDIDSAAATQILHLPNGLPDANYLRYELTALAYLLKGGVSAESAPPATPGFSALIIGTGGGRDLASALVLGAGRVDGAEINPIIVRDVMTNRFFDYSGRVYGDPRVRVHVEDGRSFVRRSRERYDVIQASLVDTWAATAAGAYTLTENSLYTTDAFEDYLDHLTDDGVLSISRWMFDGLRLVSLAQEAFARRGVEAAPRIAIVRYDRVMTMLTKREPFRREEVEKLEAESRALGFEIVYLPGVTVTPPAAGPVGDFARLILASDRRAFYSGYPLDITPVGDDRPFFFHTTRLSSQKHVAALMRAAGFEIPAPPDLDGFATGGLSALLLLMFVSSALVVLFVVLPLAVTTRQDLPAGWPRWLMYFGCLGAGFMLVEVALLQRFVLLLGHPVYSLTVTLFSLLLGTGLGATLGRHVPPDRLPSRMVRVLLGVVAMAIFAAAGLPRVIDAAIGQPLWLRLCLASALMLPAGILMGVPLPSAVRLLAERRADALVPWAWAINGVFSVVGSTLAVFVAMNWGFSTTLLLGGAVYFFAAMLVAFGGGAATERTA
jgi:spermidine synthase